MKKKTDKLIVLGVTGGIAAYKAADLTSKLTQKGYQVQVIMTENARKLVCPLTFQTLSRNRVITSLWESPDWKPEHVALEERADLFVVAPATVNFIGKLAHGIADDALSTFAVTLTCPFLIAPAMNPRMYDNPAFTENMKILKKRKINIVEPGTGHVACGEPGKGRMAEPTEIMLAIETLLK